TCATVVIPSLAEAQQVQVKPPSVTITLADARKIMAAAQEEATQLKKPIAIAVVGSRGNLIAFERERPCWAAHEISETDKAISRVGVAAIFGTPSAGPATTANSKSGQSVQSLVEATVPTPYNRGAVAIIRNHAIIGAVSVGGLGGGDEGVAKAALASAGF